jgi:acyl-CoA reductase-like NAD-dependent aldehyde dehydrogenase
MTGRSVSAVTAYTAHREWASRPPDERYASVHALYEAARARRQQLEERTIETGEFRTRRWRTISPFANRRVTPLL